MPKSLLLADDSVTIQKAVEMTFKAEDVTLIVVSDGNEALSRARAAARRRRVAPTRPLPPVCGGVGVGAF